MSKEEDGKRLQDAMDVVPGFYDDAKTEVTSVASAALSKIFADLGSDPENPSGGVRAAVFITRVDESGDEIGAAFGGYTSPMHMIADLLFTLSSMSGKLGVPMIIDTGGSEASSN
jgi:hypothetical protein